jgi:malate dehydrogenase (oxaloacetate-decarboxylating)
MFSIIYTPTEGEAIQNFSSLFRSPDGCFLNIFDQKRVHDALAQWGSSEDIDYIVVTDGEAVGDTSNFKARTIEVTWGVFVRSSALVIKVGRHLPLGFVLTRFTGVGSILISMAKLVLATLCAGVHPTRTLPVVLDCGTDVGTFLPMRERN